MTAHGRLTQPSSMDAPGNLPVQASTAKVGAGYRRAGFTLVELLITISVIAIMASMVLFALFAAQETARTQKTKSLIAKLDSIIKAKYETYKTRRVPITIPPGTPPQIAAQLRLEGLRDLMRMELPDRWSDVRDGPTSFGYPPPIGTMSVAQPSVSRGYLRMYNSITPPPSDDYGGAECLYMIIMAAQAEEGDDRSAIKPDQIGDFDNDGAPEFIDAWGQPIRFLRWAPGFISDLQVVAIGKVASLGPSDPHLNSFTATGPLANSSGTYVGGAVIKRDLNSQQFETKQMGYVGGYTVSGGTITIACTTPDHSPANPNYTKQRPFRNNGGMNPGDDFFVMAPDPFDPRHVYPIYNGTGSIAAPNPDTSLPTFALYPLIFSAGPDKGYGVAVDFPSPGLQYSTQRCNPFVLDGGGVMIGTQKQLSVETSDRMWVDNIHNHMITAR
jgi:prepilin-type N-terminal cleavage/methylation domain-containing protein